jgi:threonine/homoserine efflux transporter RhtA
MPSRSRSGLIGERLSWTQWEAIVLIMIASAGSASTAGKAPAPA